jgi:hypothetical protein
MITNTCSNCQSDKGDQRFLLHGGHTAGIISSNILPPPPLPHLELSQISEERLRRMIDRWENLLTCGVCHAVQNSLDDLLLFQYHDVQEEEEENDDDDDDHHDSRRRRGERRRPVCRVCSSRIQQQQGNNDQDDSSSNQNNQCDDDLHHPVGAVPISLLMGFGPRTNNANTSTSCSSSCIIRNVAVAFPSSYSSSSSSTISREEMAKGPALLVQTLKTLLNLIIEEKCRKQKHNDHPIVDAVVVVDPIDASTTEQTHKDIPAETTEGDNNSNDDTDYNDDGWAAVLLQKASKGGIDAIDRRRMTTLSSRTDDDDDDAAFHEHRSEKNEDVSRTRYTSSDRSFFPKTLSSPKNPMAQVGPRGEIYDRTQSKRWRRRRYLEVDPSLTTTLSQQNPSGSGTQESDRRVQGTDPLEWADEKDSSSLLESSSPSTNEGEDACSAEKMNVMALINTTTNDVGSDLGRRDTESEVRKIIDDQRETSHIHNYAVDPLSSVSDTMDCGSLQLNTDRRTRSDNEEDVQSPHSPKSNSTSDFLVFGTFKDLPCDCKEKNLINSISNKAEQLLCSKLIHETVEVLPSASGTMILSVPGQDATNHTAPPYCIHRDMPPPEVSTSYQQSITSPTMAGEKLSQLTETSLSQQSGNVCSKTDDKVSRGNFQTTMTSTENTHSDAHSMENNKAIPIHGGTNQRGELCHSSLVELADPYDLEASIDSRLLPQTADFAPHVTHDASCESSIDSRLLPETPDILGVVPKYYLFNRSYRSSSTNTASVNKLNGSDDKIPHFSSKVVDPTFQKDRVGIKKRSPLKVRNTDSYPIDGMLGPCHSLEAPNSVGTSRETTKQDNAVIKSQPLRRGGGLGGTPSGVHCGGKQQPIDDSPLKAIEVELPQPFLTVHTASIPRTDGSHIVDIAGRATTPHTTICADKRDTPTNRILCRDDFDKYTSAGKNHELRRGVDTNASLITPPCNTLSKRNVHQMQTLCIVVDQHDEMNDQRFRSLFDGRICEIYTNSDIKRSLLSTMDILPSSDNTIVVVSDVSLSSNATLFTTDPNAQVACHVCIPNFEYLLARTMGWNLVSSECLNDLPSGDILQSNAIPSTVWGDIVTYGKSLDVIGRPVDSSNLWLKRTLWWNRPDLSPIRSSMIRRNQDIPPLLSSYNIMVPNFGDKAGYNDEDRFPSSLIGGLSDGSTHLQELDFEEVRNL